MHTSEKYHVTDEIRLSERTVAERDGSEQEDERFRGGDERAERTAEEVAARESTDDSEPHRVQTEDGTRELRLYILRELIKLI